MSKRNLDRHYTASEVLRLGRALRRISRSTRELLEKLDIPEEDIKYSRRKKAEVHGNGNRTRHEQDGKSSVVHH